MLITALCHCMRLHLSLAINWLYCIQKKTFCISYHLMMQSSPGSNSSRVFFRHCCLTHILTPIGASFQCKPIHSLTHGSERKLKHTYRCGETHSVAFEDDPQLDSFIVSCVFKLIVACCNTCFSCCIPLKNLWWFWYGLGVDVLLHLSILLGVIYWVLNGMTWFMKCFVLWLNEDLFVLP